MSDSLRVRFQMACVIVALVLPARCPPARGTFNGIAEGPVCHGFEDGVLVAGTCDRSDPLWYADEHLRRAAAAPVCWWHASPERLQDIRGVGPATARRLAEHRAGGGSWDDVESVRGIGPVLNAAFARGSTTQCAHVPIASPSAGGAAGPLERVIPWDE